jgi:hypothetical protein
MVRKTLARLDGPMVFSQSSGRPAAGEGGVMLFMVIEHFRDRDAKSVYRRFRDKGRMAPEGLTYVSSFVEAGFGRCFQLMECDDLKKLQAWILNWSDLVDFEVVPVLSSADTAGVVDEARAGEA